VASPFDVLGLDPDADDAAIKAAYRERVLEAHPDHGGSPEEFKAVREAYEELKASAGASPGEIELDETDTSGSDATGSAATDDTDDAGASGGSRSEPSGATVEYLNYQALVDEGWGLDDDDLFEKAADAGLDPADYGRILVKPDESLLEAAENRGFAWPYACRGGACTNCAVAVVEGEMPMPTSHVLPQELTDRGIRLSCISGPTTDDMKVVYNVKHLPGVDELLLPPSRFEKARPTD
jgi:curved DNA-binding protein CbpA